MLDKLAHKRKDICVIGCRSKHYSAIAERILHRLRHVAARKVVNNNFGATFFFKLVSKQLHSLFCMTVNGSIGNHNAVAFNAV